MGRCLIFLWFAQWSYFYLIMKWSCFLSPLWPQSDCVWCWCSVRLCPTECHDLLPKPAPDSWGPVLSIMPVSECQGLLFSFLYLPILLYCWGLKIENSYANICKNTCQSGNEVNNSYIDVFLIWNLFGSRNLGHCENSQEIGSKQATLLSTWNKSPQMPHTLQELIFTQVPSTPFCTHF